MADIFSTKEDKKADNHEAETKELHAKIGELTVENVSRSGWNAIFCHGPSNALSGAEEGASSRRSANDCADRKALVDPSMLVVKNPPLGLLFCLQRGKCL
jgi:hypothetical protein